MSDPHSKFSIGINHFRITSSMRALLVCAAVATVSALNGCGGGSDDSSSDTAASAPVVDKYPSVVTPKTTLLPAQGFSSARNYPFMAADYDPKAFGFVEEEYLIEGSANTYDTNLSWADLSKYLNTYPVTQNAKVVTTGNPYRTRMMVYRPTDPAKFNGTVIVEWVNATNGFDTPIHWFEQKNMVFRKGYAYVWVSNQDMTVAHDPSARGNTLKEWSPARYGTLDVSNGGKLTGEELSWDIYSQVAKAVRYDSKVMGGMPVKKVLAVGESQSAMRLSVYLNSHHPLTGNIYDGALVTNSGAAQRTDLSVPIIKILTETEFESKDAVQALGLATAGTNETTVLQPDTEKYKTWMITGSTHSNLTSMIPRAVQYQRDFNGRMIADAACSAHGQNSRVPLTYAYNAGIVALEKYISNKTAMPTGTQFQYTASLTAPTLARDADGIALGGVRYPDVAVPVAVNSGYAAAGCNYQAGYHVPFSKAKLDSLYSSHDDYVNKVSTAANSAVSAGFLLQEDAQDMIANATSSIYGYKLNCDGDSGGNLCQDQWYFPQHPSIQTLRWHIYLYYLPNRSKILAPVDDAAKRIATAYNTADAATKKLFFSQAIADLQLYSNLIQDESTGGTLSSDAAVYLTGQAERLITELRKQ